MVQEQAGRASDEGKLHELGSHFADAGQHDVVCLGDSRLHLDGVGGASRFLEGYRRESKERFASSESGSHSMAR